MVGEGKRLAGGLLGPYRQDMIGRCDRTEALMTSLADMASRGEAEDPHARATAAQLQDSLKVAVCSDLKPSTSKSMQQLIHHELVQIESFK